MSKYDALFEPMTLKNVELKNRIAMAPMNVCFTGPNHVVSKQQTAYYAARAMGGSGPYVTLRHLLPNSLGPVIVLVTFGVPRAIFAEAALSYIGIGVQPPTPSWGTMILDGYNNIFGAPYLVLFPAIAVGILMLAFTFLGDGLRDALDPRERR